MISLRATSGQEEIVVWVVGILFRFGFCSNGNCLSEKTSNPKRYRKREGGFPERSKGSDCKSDGYAFTGSNPVPPTEWRGSHCNGRTRKAKFEKAVERNEARLSSLKTGDRQLARAI